MRSLQRWFVSFMAIAVCADRAAAAPIVQNPSFEGGFTSVNGVYGAISDWSQAPFPSNFEVAGYDYLSGVSTTAGFPWDNGTVPGEGTSGNVGFVQVTGNVTELSLEQTISGFAPGSQYYLTYQENSRALTQSAQITVLLGGNVIVAPHLDTAVDPQGTYATPFHQLTSSLFTVPSGSALLEVRVDLPGGSTDATALLDNFSVVLYTPEPAAAVLLGLGAAGLVVASRRRRRGKRPLFATPASRDG